MKFKSILYQFKKKEEEKSCKGKDTNLISPKLPKKYIKEKF